MSRIAEELSLAWDAPYESGMRDEDRALLVDQDRFASIRESVKTFDSPSTDNPEWEAVCENVLLLWREGYRDLRLIAYGTWASLYLASPGREAVILCRAARLLGQPIEAFSPSLSRPRARVSIATWLIKKLEAYFLTVDKRGYARSEYEKLYGSLVQLKDAAADQVPDVNLNWHPVFESIPRPVEENIVSSSREDFAVSDGKIEAPPVLTPPAQLISGRDTAIDLWKIGDLWVSIAEERLCEKISDQRAWRLFCTGLWLGFEKIMAPGNKENNTVPPAPKIVLPEMHDGWFKSDGLDLLKMMRRMWQHSRLQLCIPQKIAFILSTQPGLELASDAILSSCRAFVARHPILLKITAKDGTAVCPQEVQAWLFKDGNSVEEKTSITSKKSCREVRNSASCGNKTAAQKSFLARLKKAKHLLDHENADAALATLVPVWDIVHRHRLDRWQPILAVNLVSIALRAHTVLEGGYCKYVAAGPLGSPKHLIRFLFRLEPELAAQFIKQHQIRKVFT